MTGPNWDDDIDDWIDDYYEDFDDDDYYTESDWGDNWEWKKKKITSLLNSG